MGEAPAFFSNDCETAASIGKKTYLIGGGHDDDAISIKVQIFNQSSGEMVDPIVLGTKPKSSQGLSAIAISNDRILVIKGGSDSNDCVWFLEVDTPYVQEKRKGLGSEAVAWSKGVRGRAEKPVVISGPSGVGKGTLISMLMKDFPSMFGFSVSHTTRPPRNGEKNRVHYHFTERSLMEDEIKEGKFLEFASVHGNLYGTSIESVELVADEGKRCILDIDVQGARSIRASTLEAVFIFICPPSMTELENRLRSRRTENDEQILKRLHNAKAEIELGQSSNVFDHVIYNDNLQSCYENLKKLLGLDEHLIRTSEFERNRFDIPVVSSTSMVDNKIFITSEANDLGQDPKKETRKLYVLNLSSLTGGAPGRTQGVDFGTS